MSSESRNDSNIEHAAYRKLLFENVVSGRAATVRGDGGEETIESAKGGVQRVSWGASIAKGVDLAELARLALSARSEANAPLKPLVEEEIVESSRLEDASANLVLDGPPGSRACAAARGSAGKLVEDSRSSIRRAGNDPALMRDPRCAAILQAAAIEVDRRRRGRQGRTAGSFAAKSRAGLRSRERRRWRNVEWIFAQPSDAAICRPAIALEGAAPVLKPLSCWRA
jgi:hypothetical protein